MFQFWKLLLEFIFYIYNFKKFESKIFYFNSKNCYWNSLFIIWIWNLIFQFWIFTFIFLKKLILKIIFLWKLLFQLFKELFEFEIWYWILNYYFRFWQLIFQFQFKKLFDLKLEIAIPNYYFGFSKLIFQFRKLLIESKNWHFNSEIFNLNSKTYFI